MALPEPSAPPPATPAEAAWARGDFGAARRLVRDPPPADDPIAVAGAARVRFRLAPDPVMIFICVAAGLLIAFVAWRYGGG